MMLAMKAGRLVLLAAMAAACRSDRPGSKAAPTAAPAAAPATSAAPQLVHVAATDFKFDIPATIPAGPVTLHLMNDGKQMHQAMLMRLEEGKTVADLAQAMKANGPLPSWLKFRGGPNGVAPGGTAAASMVLTPGSYAVICLIPGPDGIPHAAKGMIQGFEVTGSSAEAALPIATDTLRLKDYAFESSRPLTAGSHAVLVVNDGPQVHELVVLKLVPGKTVKDFGDWATTGGMKGPPPAVPIGGVGVLDTGATSVFNADLTAGEYAYICFVPDAKDGKPHLAHGMTHQFTVN